MKLFPLRGHGKSAGKLEFANLTKFYYAVEIHLCQKFPKSNDGATVSFELIEASFKQ
jgi:hypothetical protein